MVPVLKKNQGLRKKPFTWFPVALDYGDLQPEGWGE